MILKFSMANLSYRVTEVTRLRCRRPSIPHCATFTTASRMLEPLIFDTPSSRSVKVIGTSATTNPLVMVRQVRSIWKQ